MIPYSITDLHPGWIFHFNPVPCHFFREACQHTYIHTYIHGWMAWVFNFLKIPVVLKSFSSSFELWHICVCWNHSQRISCIRCILSVGQGHALCVFGNYAFAMMISFWNFCRSHGKCTRIIHLRSGGSGLAFSFSPSAFVLLSSSLLLEVGYSQRYWHFSLSHVATNCGDSRRILCTTKTHWCHKFGNPYG